MADTSVPRESEDVPHIPPPKYDPPMSECSTSLPLPTYTQSEKYEKEGVLEYVSDDEENSESSSEIDPGTCCDFTVFFLICVVFSVIGFIFSFCMASTVAAQSGAVAGLGVAFISKPIVFEMYSMDYVNQHSRANYCNSYWGYDSEESISTCVQRSYNVLRCIFFIIGLIGLYLLYKGVATYMKTRNSRLEN